MIAQRQRATSSSNAEPRRKLPAPFRSYLPRPPHAVQPFDLLEYDEPERLDRALGVQPKWNAWVELHNLIAAAESAHDYGPADVQRIGRAHGVDLHEAFAAERRGLYAKYLDHCLDNGDLAERERGFLAHLADTLHLSSGDLQPVRERAFGRTVSDVLSDDCVTLEERLLLYKLQHTLGLDPDLAEGTYETMAREKLLVAVAHALCDGMLSPDEQREIEALEAEFGVGIPRHVETLLEQAAQTWAIHNGPLPRIDVWFRLLPGEIGHYQTPGQWRRLNYARLRILLSAHRAGLMRGETDRLRIPSKALYGKRYEGRLVVTNKRLILARENRKPIAYYLRSLSVVERYINGLRVGLPDNRSLHLNAGRVNRALHSVLVRLLSA